jgi:hypothetical protein
MYAIDMASDGMIYTSTYQVHEDCCRRSGNMKVMSQKSENLQCWYTDGKRLRSMKCTNETGSGGMIKVNLSL